MQAIKQIEQITWPDTELCDNFQFDGISSAGVFTLHFKWLNDRWNLWVTLPGGEIRQAGVQPGVTSWTGNSDYGLHFKADLESIDYQSLFLTELYLFTWQ